jgi:site-specific recombinase XerD
MNICERHNVEGSTRARGLTVTCLFPGVNSNIVTMAFTRACRCVGIADSRRYDLCHTFGTYLAMAEFNLRALQSLLGHQDLGMTMHNSHLSAEHLHKP